MFLPKPTEGGTLELTPAGTYVAICYRFVDRGTQIANYNGERKSRREVLLTWELPDEKMEDGRPFSASRTYTWSMHEKSSLRKDLESWRGRSFTDADFEGPEAFNTKKLLGAPCMLTITHTTKDDKTYSNISAIGKLVKGIQVAPLTNKLTYIALVKGEFDMEAFGTLSDKMKEIITGSPEYKELMKSSRQHGDPGNGYHMGNDPDDDIPF